MPAIELYDRPDCPYSKRVRRVLEVLSIEYDEIVVSADKDDRDELEARTGQRGIPVLFDDNHPDGWISDSSAISAYLKDAYK